MFIVDADFLYCYSLLLLFTAATIHLRCYYSSALQLLKVGLAIKLANRKALIALRFLEPLTLLPFSEL